MMLLEKPGLFKLLIVVIFLLLLGGLIFLLLRYRDVKQNQERVAFVKQNSQNLDPKSLIPSPKPGIEISSTQQGSTTAKLVGVLNNAYQKEADYFLDLKVTESGKVYIIKANLGEKDMIIAENTREYDEQNLRYTNRFVNKSVEEMFTKYKALKGEQIAIVVLVDADTEAYKNNCDDVCKKRLALFNEYSANNQILMDLSNLSDSLEVGLVTQISQ